ncbi:MAG: hypothetical protein DHS20C17_35960 [Cyclobacteriaceae bacterium]|nr:MAG: hypothetical protein DHS20C17_35960 [Cyclobacteriaceae bacterium]
MFVLNGVSNIILKRMGIDATGEHEAHISEEEIRASLSIAYSKGELTKVEHRLLNAVFRFDDEIARRILVPRNEVEFLDINLPFQQLLEIIKKSGHSRFPLCDGSLDKILGVIHVKDITGYDFDDNLNLKNLARPVMVVPENILIGSLLQEFRANKQHFACVQNEHGTVLGIVTMEDVLEELVGSIQDEFDLEDPQLIEQGAGKYLVKGDILIDELNHLLDLELAASEADTLSGLIVERFGHKIQKGKKFTLDQSVEIELIETDGIRVLKASLVLLSEDTPQQ